MIANFVIFALPASLSLSACFLIAQKIVRLPFIPRSIVAWITALAVSILCLSLIGMLFDLGLGHRLLSNDRTTYAATGWASFLLSFCLSSVVLILIVVSEAKRRYLEGKV
ncbi:hypothetical protein [Ruegeria sp. HKCCD7559]|uniref:hypothetical protein n=1 Tax=Ruegeria sp. HKCCD7559 TaxID=2683005 RepID=UPI0014913F97|nr:hypothetical protein [Ruegeria sp. HKCCD7559]NOC45954.1 hypothetical protein [Ruegeria sp. HKCCD7559]